MSDHIHKMIIYPCPNINGWFAEGMDLWLIPAESYGTLVFTLVVNSDILYLYDKGQVCLTGIPAWIINKIHYIVWDEITYPFPNFNGGNIEVWEWISNFSPTHYWACDYLSVLGLKLNHDSKRWHSNRQLTNKGLRFNEHRNVYSPHLLITRRYP